MGTKLTDDLRKAIKAQLTSRPKPQNRVKTRHRLNPWAGGFKSDALGVGVHQISEAREEMRKHGVLVDFDKKTGACILESQKQYRDACRAIGMYDGRDGFYVPEGPDEHRVLTGKAQIAAREEFKRKLLEE